MLELTCPHCHKQFEAEEKISLACPHCHTRFLISNGLKAQTTQLNTNNVKPNERLEGLKPTCPHCHFPFRTSGIGDYCHNCYQSFLTIASKDAAIKKQEKSKLAVQLVSQPKEMRIETLYQNLIISWRWFPERSLGNILVGLLPVAFWGFVALTISYTLWDIGSQDGNHPAFWFCAFPVLSMFLILATRQLYAIVSTFFNTTTITISHNTIIVESKPLLFRDGRKEFSRDAFREGAIHEKMLSDDNGFEYSSRLFDILIWDSMSKQETSFLHQSVNLNHILFLKHTIEVYLAIDKGKNSEA